MRVARATVVGDTRGDQFAQHLHCRRHPLTDESKAFADGGPTPADYLLTELGVCTVITLCMYAARTKWYLGTIATTLELVRENDAERIEREVSFTASLTDEQHGRLADLCERTPVARTVKQRVPIRTRLRGA